MKSKKAMGLALAAILAVNTVVAFGDNVVNVKPINQGSPIIEAMPIKAEDASIDEYKFGVFSGKVKEIAKYEPVEGALIALIESQGGEIANFIISKDTFVLNNAEIKVGDEVTGYYNANAPMILIYPAQYSMEVVVVANPNNKIVKVDTFDKELISSDNFLKLNISDSTEIVSKDGKAYKGELASKKLVVQYEVSTKSIPSQTNPIKITVLEDKKVYVIGDVGAMEFMVAGKKLDAPAAYMNEKGIIMVPVRVLSEALGHEVIWNNQDKSVMLGKGITFKIGEDNYIYMKTAPIKLGTAPEVKDSKTYVPLSFFREVLKLNNAYVFEGQIIINNEEKMK